MTAVDEYADEHLPFAAYAGLVATYGAATGAGAAIAMRGKPRNRGASLSEVVLLGVATHKLSRLISRDTVTSFLRAPFTRYEQPGGMNELDESARGSGWRRAIGELLVCPPCIGLWVGTALGLAHWRAPRLTRAMMSILAAQTVSDTLHIGYQAALKRS